MIDLHANNLAFQQRDRQPEQWQPGRPACRRGGSVYLAEVDLVPVNMAAAVAARVDSVRT